MCDIVCSKYEIIHVSKVKKIIIILDIFSQ